MAEPKQRQVKMLVSMAGEGFAYQPDDTPFVDEEFAVALCTEPADDPRAEPLGWELSEVAGAAERAPKRPTRARRRKETSVADKREKAVAPETREVETWGDDDVDPELQ